MHRRAATGDGAGKNRGRSPQSRSLGMIIAGGGTGGHLFPGIAIAEEFLRRNPSHRILFIGTERGLEKKILGGLGLPLRTIRVEGIKGRRPTQTPGALAKIPGSLVASFRILREFSPDIVVGVGGYASGPAVLAARLMGMKTAIAEQNAFPGLTNRILGNFTDRIFLAFSASQRWFPKRQDTGYGKSDPGGLPCGKTGGGREPSALHDPYLRRQSRGARDQPDRQRSPGRPAAPEGPAQLHPPDGGERSGDGRGCLRETGLYGRSDPVHYGHGRGIP